MFGLVFVLNSIEGGVGIRQVVFGKLEVEAAGRLLGGALGPESGDDPDEDHSEEDAANNAEGGVHPFRVTRGGL